MALPPWITDFVEYGRRFLKIKARTGGRMLPLRLKPVQQRIEAVVQRSHAVGRPALIIIDKSRRLGTSTYTAGRISHRCFTRRYERAVVMAHRGPDAKKIFQIYEWMHEHLPPEIRPQKAGSKGQQLNLYRLYSQIDVGSAESTTFGRGGDVQVVHLSECAYYPNPEELLTAIMPGFPATGDGILILESTANGPGTWWHAMWQQALSGESESRHAPVFTPLFFAWYEDPEHTLPDDAVPVEAWTDEEREWADRFGVTGAQMAWLRWRQEVDCSGRDDMRRREYPATADDSFASVGAVAWTTEQVTACYRRGAKVEVRGILTRDGGVRAHPEGPLTLWERPMERSLYVIGADPAGGLNSGDEAAATVWRVGKKEGEWPIQVGELALHEDPVSFAESLMLLGHYFNRALLACEGNSVGKGTQAALMRLYHYPRLHRWMKWDVYRSKSESWGWETSHQSKQVLMSIADWLIRKQLVVLRSPALYTEFLHFQQDRDGQYRCMAGTGHGDRLMSAMIAWVSWFQHRFQGVPLRDLRATLARNYGGTGDAETEAARRLGGDDDGVALATEAEMEELVGAVGPVARGRRGDMARVWNEPHQARRRAMGDW